MTIFFDSVKKYDTLM